MASISNDKNGNRSIQFIAPDRKRRTIRLGQVTKKAADTIKVNVEAIPRGQVLRRQRRPRNGRLDRPDRSAAT
jgi:hypothetical protein